jgi:uncharacterized protein YecT (DUF1311 family)
MFVGGLLIFSPFTGSASCLNVVTTQQQMPACLPACLRSAYKKADAELSLQYQHVPERARGVQARLLRAAQSQQDANCTIQTSRAQGTSAFVLNHSQCLMRIVVR